MTVTIHQTPSGSYLFRGILTQKKLTAKSKRHVVLCLPTTPDDIKFIHDQLTLSSALKTSPNLTSEQSLEILAQGDTTIYGHLALSAISGFPVLILGSTVRTFIHFSQIQGMFDETDLEAACTFAILTAHREYRFSAETSVDYQKWIGALSQAFEKMTVLNNDYRPPSDAFMTTLERNNTSMTGSAANFAPGTNTPSDVSYNTTQSAGRYPTPSSTPLNAQGGMVSAGIPSSQGNVYTHEKQQPHPPRYRSRSRPRSMTGSHSDVGASVAWNARLSRDVENVASDDSSDRKRANIMDRVVSFFRRDLTLDEIVEQRRSRSRSRSRSLSRFRSKSFTRSTSRRRRFSFAALLGTGDEDGSDDAFSTDESIDRRGRRSRGESISSRIRSRSRSVSRFLSNLLTSSRQGDETNKAI